jgi:hypothetical protein
MRSKGQGAIEYLLIIAAAILVVAIVILAVTGALEGGQNQSNTSEVEVFDAFHDLRIKNLGYKIEIVAADHSYASLDGTIYCSQTGTGNYCRFPVTNYPCTTPMPEMELETLLKLELVDKTTGEVTLQEFNIGGINDHASEKKTFKYTYMGDPNNEHHLKITFNDTCDSCDGVENGDCTLNRKKYHFDRNLKIYSVTLKNSDGKETFNYFDATGLCSSETCVDSDFQ